MKRSFQTNSIIILIALIYFSFAGPVKAETTEFLSTEKVLGVTALSITTLGLGRHVAHFSDQKKSLIKGPFPFDDRLQRLFAGKYYSGKTNFLDNQTGSLLTPVVTGAMLVTSNLAYGYGSKQKQAWQDIFLLTTGAGLTKGLTDLTKGIFARPRPFTRFESDITPLTKKNGQAWSRHSFFSGHSSGAFYSMAYLNLRMRSLMRDRLTVNEWDRWHWLSPVVCYSWASIVGWSRVHAYKHYPSDVLLGALTGWLIAELMFSLNDDQRGNQPNNSPAPMLLRFTIPL